VITSSLKYSFSRTSKVLAVGCDPDSLAASASILRNAGFIVSPATVQQTLRLLDTELFDAVVLCHTLNSRQASAVLALVQSLNREMPVIQVYSDTPDPAFRFAAPSYNPSILLSVLGRALGGDMRALRAIA